MSTTTRSGPLSRFTIIDASRVRAGPTAVRHFADMGARVIKLEIPAGAPGGDDMIGGRDHNRADYENLHRNKESLTLNMKTREGVAILHELVKKADVFIENYRPDVKHRLGIGPDQLRAINPRLVYASISGFGQDGPAANWPGFDSIAQGMGGLMSVTGRPDEGPMRVGIPIADLCAGHFCAMGILTALLEREVSGEGQWVQTSLLESQIAMLDFQAAQWLIDKQSAGSARQRASADGAHGRVQDEGRPPQHRGDRPDHVEAAVRGAGAVRAGRRAGPRLRCRAGEESRPRQQRDRRGAHRAQHR